MNSGEGWKQVSLSTRPFHELAPVHLLRGVLIMGTAEQPNAVQAVDARSREAVQMIEFQTAGFGASVATVIGKGAAATLSTENSPHT